MLKGIYYSITSRRAVQCRAPETSYRQHGWGKPPWWRWGILKHIGPGSSLVQATYTRSLIT